MVQLASNGAEAAARAAEAQVAAAHAIERLEIAVRDTNKPGAITQVMAYLFQPGSGVAVLRALIWLLLGLIGGTGLVGFLQHFWGAT